MAKLTDNEHGEEAEIPLAAELERGCRYFPANVGKGSSPYNYLSSDIDYETGCQYKPTRYPDG